MSELHRVLFVDDEPNVLAGIARHLRNRFDVTTAVGGAAGLALLKGEKPFAVIVSDLRMPEMDGIEFLTRAREAAPDSVRILLTGNADLEAAISLMNAVNVFRFLQKPCAPQELIASVEAGAQQHQLITAERVLLEETLRGSVKALTDLLALVNPSAFGKAQRVRRIVEKVAAQMELPVRWKLEVAAMLSQVGCIVLPPSTVEKLHQGAPLSETEQGMARRLPKIAADLIARIPRLEEVREILLEQDDPIPAHQCIGARAPGPGSAATPAAAGAPMSVLAGPPIGSRILKAALDLDMLEASGMATAAAIATLRSRTGRYDPAVLDALEPALGAAHLDLVLKEVPLREVRPGMVFVNDVRTRNGLLLIAHGQEVTRSLVERLQNAPQGLDVEQRVRVHLRRESEAAAAPASSAASSGENAMAETRGG